MVNNLISAIVLGVLVYVWYYVGTAVPWVNDGAFSVMGADGQAYAIPGLGYLFFSFLAFSLARSGK
ncbi:MAG TPA: hypothetical protein VD713_07235 [Sphingomonadales bacterium]|nr:hypothetical protein [Sphingomonadales bacterium]